MEKVKKSQRSIGYWIRKADEVLSARLDEAQAAHGLSAADWQVLDLLHAADFSSHERLLEFLHGRVDGFTLGQSLRRLAQRELIEGDAATAHRLRLTERGRRLRESTRTMRQKVRHREVVSESDYATTIRVLQRLVENLRAGEDL